jgi:DNA-binding MltR family transcriptional regulator
LGLCSRGILGLGLIEVHLYYDLSWQVKRLRVVFKVVLGLGLMMLHVHYDAALQGRRLRSVYNGCIMFRADSGAFVL